MKNWFGVLLGLLIAGLVAVILLDNGRTAVPAFRIHNLQGAVVDNSRLQGKVTLLNFWYPSCPGCVSEMPKLIKMSQDYRDKEFQVLAVAVPIDDLARVQEYVKQRRLPFEVMFDADKSVTKSMVKRELYPTSLLIDKKGRILQTFIGEPNFIQLYQTVDSELAQ